MIYIHKRYLYLNTELLFSSRAFICGVRLLPTSLLCGYAKGLWPRMHHLGVTATSLYILVFCRRSCNDTVTINSSEAVYEFLGSAWSTGCLGTAFN